VVGRSTRVISFHSVLLTTFTLVACVPGAARAQAPPSTPKKSTGTEHHVGPGWDTHPVFWLGKYGRLDLRVRLQEDRRATEVPLTEGTWFTVLRRVGVGGQIAGGIDFEVNGEVGLIDPWRDAYVNVRRFPAFMVQGGKFKVPFGLDQLTSESSFDFIYRSRIADQLSPGRDRGVMVHGRNIGHWLNYQLGVFVHDGGNSRTTDPARVVAGRTAAARVVVMPFATRTTSAFAGLQIAIDGTTGEVTPGLLSLRGRTAARAVFFSPRISVNGDVRRQGADLQWRPGPFSVRAEIIRATVARDGLGDNGANLAAITARGWYVSGSWALTGERKASGSDVPAHPLFEGGFGGVELAARVERLGFDPHAAGVPSNADSAQTYGVNWYLDRWSKVQFNAIHERLANAAIGPVPAHAAFWTHVVRVQFKF